MRDEPSGPTRVTLPQETIRKVLRDFRGRLRWVGLYFLVVIAAGTFGYHALGQQTSDVWTWLDSFYMTVITATCVGYAEVHPLTEAGRVFTTILLAFSLLGLGLLWAMTTALIVELDLRDVFRRRRMTNKIEKLSGHYIVCGAGRMGAVIIDEIMSVGEPLVVVEQDDERIELIRQDHPDILVIDGDATREGTLEQAGVARATGLATCLSSDADNLLVALIAREAKRDLSVVARAQEEESLRRMRRAGADHVISPNVTGGSRMAAMLLRPSVVSFLDAATHEGELSLRLEQAAIPDTSSLVGKSLAEAQIPQATGLVVLALRQADSKQPPTYNPGPASVLSSGDVLVVLGKEEQVGRLREYVAQ